MPETPDNGTTQITPIFSFTAAKDLIPLMTAYAAARKAIGPIVNDKVAKMGSFNSPYAALATVLGTIHEAALANGLVYMQNISVRFETPAHGQRYALVYAERYIFHIESGQILQFAPYELIPEGSKPTDIGGATTYARRYTALNDWGVDDQANPDDDDGARASGYSAEITDRRTGRTTQVRPETERKQQATAQHRNPPQATVATPAPTPQAVAQTNGHTAQSLVQPVVEQSPSPSDNGSGHETSDDTPQPLIDIQAIHSLGELVYGAENWENQMFATAVTMWETKAQKEHGRAPVRSVDNMIDSDRVIFYTQLKRTLEGIRVKQLQKQQESAPAAV